MVLGEGGVGKSGNVCVCVCVCVLVCVCVCVCVSVCEEAYMYIHVAGGMTHTYCIITHNHFLYMSNVVSPLWSSGPRALVCSASSIYADSELHTCMCCQL